MYKSTCGAPIPKHDYKPIRQTIIDDGGEKRQATIYQCARRSCYKEITVYVVAY
jgi:hypothetical protein